MNNCVVKAVAIATIACAGIFPSLVVAMTMTDVMNAFNGDFDRPTPERLVERYVSIIQHVSGLQVAGDVPLARKSPGDLRAEHHDSYKNMESVQKHNSDVGLFFLLERHGLVEDGVSENDWLGSDTFEDVLAFYNPEKKAITLIEGIQSSEVGGVLLHELVHAAQDSHVSLDSYYEKHGQSIDGYLASAAIVEGQAQALEYLVLLSEQSNSDQVNEWLETFNARLDQGFADSGVEEIGGKLRTFPYYFGMNLVLNRYIADEVTSFETMLRNPPVTTEQILHRAKLLEAESADVTVLEQRQIKDSMGPDILFSSTLGEFYIREMISGQPDGDRERASRVGAGWGGDFVVVFGPEKGKTLIWDTLWDSEKDAKEFYQAYKQFRGNLLGADALARSEAFDVALAGELYIHKSGSRVVVFEGPWPPQELSRTARTLGL